MLIYPFIPIPISLVLILIIIGNYIYNNMYLKSNHYEINRDIKIEKKIVRNCTLILVYLILMMCLKGKSNLRLYFFLIGFIVLTIMYITTLMGYMVFKYKNVENIDCSNIVKLKYGRKKGLYYLIAAAIVFRFSFISILLFDKPFNVIKVIILSALIIVGQSYYRSNVKMYGKVHYK